MGWLWQRTQRTQKRVTSVAVGVQAGAQVTTDQGCNKVEITNHNTLMVIFPPFSSNYSLFQGSPVFHHSTVVFCLSISSIQHAPYHM